MVGSKKIGIVIVVAIVILVVMGISQTNTLSKQKVEVTGSVTTVGIGTQPIRVDFEPTVGKPTSVTVDSNNYSVKLDAPESYKIKVTYSASGITTPFCDAGTLNLETSPNPRTYDIKC